MRAGLVLFLALGLFKPGVAQQTIIPFTSGPIPLCDTSTFTANVAGIGMLYPPGFGMWSYWLSNLTINITSDHPQTLRIFLTSPEGTELLLSQFNGAGGQNYTSTTFAYDGYPSITTGSAPFTGTWNAQGGSFSVFDYENADGQWTITVIDTACANGGVGPGGTWTPGWFDGSSGNGGFAFAFVGPPPCWAWIPSDVAYICPGGTVDLVNYYNTNAPGYNYSFTMPDGWTPVPDPTAVSTPGTYQVNATDPWGGCWYWATYDVIVTPPVSLGPDQVVQQCAGAGPVNLASLFTLAGATPIWTLDGAPITTAVAGAATAPGVYQLIGQSTGGCDDDTASVALNITADPVLGPDQTVSICAGTSFDLTTLYATGTNTTEWTESGLPVADPAAVTNAGIYTLTVTNGTGCTATADVTVAAQASPSLGADQSLDLCGNVSLDLTTLYTTTGLTTSWTLMGLPVPDPTSVSAAIRACLTQRSRSTAPPDLRTTISWWWRTRSRSQRSVRMPRPRHALATWSTSPPTSPPPA